MLTYFTRHRLGRVVVWYPGVETNTGWVGAASSPVSDQPAPLDRRACPDPQPTRACARPRQGPIKYGSARSLAVPRLHRNLASHGRPETAPDERPPTEPAPTVLCHPPSRLVAPPWPARALHPSPEWCSPSGRPGRNRLPEQQLPNRCRYRVLLDSYSRLATREAPFVQQVRGSVPSGRA